jgi:sporulation protein YlmC with PRC-barrel domain
MRLTDLRHKKVRSLNGEQLGRVFEVHCDKGRVTALMIGGGSLYERFTARKGGRRIPWELVKRVQAKTIIVSPDLAQWKPANGNTTQRPKRH